MDDDVRQAEMELVEHDRAELVQARLNLMQPINLARHALELGGVHIGMLPEAVRAAVSREVREHEVDLQHHGRGLVETLVLYPELAHIVHFHLFLAIADEETARRESALLLDDVRRYEVMVVCPRLRLAGGNIRDLRCASEVGVGHGKNSVGSVLAVQSGSQVVQALVEKVHVPEALVMDRNFHH
eukprot:CAMPEP_0198603058 /NCGR_PEP_ID=MMETSP1462-20131121/151483_1 /TAXON_ID=1333877 /ORGANISM="Brandtodinium nutriculum, Strain RCC3387" /LENGTH=184 /DNA_ID=CAMNT_0044334827 /DNA_START=62 /DNA_END=613 /DNA_ORIENTATION=-